MWNRKENKVVCGDGFWFYSEMENICSNIQNLVLIPYLPEQLWQVLSTIYFIFHNSPGLMEGAIALVCKWRNPIASGYSALCETPLPVISWPTPGPGPSEVRLISCSHTKANWTVQSYYPSHRQANIPSFHYHPYLDTRPFTVVSICLTTSNAKPWDRGTYWQLGIMGTWIIFGIWIIPIWISK